MRCFFWRIENRYRPFGWGSVPVWVEEEQAPKAVPSFFFLFQNWYHMIEKVQPGGRFLPVPSHALQCRGRVPWGGELFKRNSACWNRTKLLYVFLCLPACPASVWINGSGFPGEVLHARSWGGDRLIGCIAAVPCRKTRIASSQPPCPLPLFFSLLPPTRQEPASHLASALKKAWCLQHGAATMEEPQQHLNCLKRLKDVWGTYIVDGWLEKCRNSPSIVWETESQLPEENSEFFELLVCLPTSPSPCLGSGILSSGMGFKRYWTVLWPCHFLFPASCLSPTSLLFSFLPCLSSLWQETLSGTEVMITCCR